MEHGLHLKKPECVDLGVHVRVIIGTLMYASIATRPDISFVVNYLSSYQGTPTQEILKYAKIILAYLASTNDYTLNLFRNQQNTDPEINVFTDASQAPGRDRVSTSGVLIQLWKNSNIWRTTKQRSAAKSSAEAEMLAMSESRFLCNV